MSPARVRVRSSQQRRSTVARRAPWHRRCSLAPERIRRAARSARRAAQRCEEHARYRLLLRADGRRRCTKPASRRPTARSFGRSVHRRRRCRPSARDRRAPAGRRPLVEMPIGVVDGEKLGPVSARPHAQSIRAAVADPRDEPLRAPCVDRRRTARPSLRRACSSAARCSARSRGPLRGSARPDRVGTERGRGRAPHGRARRARGSRRTPSAPEPTPSATTKSPRFRQADCVRLRSRHAAARATTRRPHEREPIALRSPLRARAAPQTLARAVGRRRHAGSLRRSVLIRRGLSRRVTA